jgi:hypothetical protein
MEKRDLADFHSNEVQNAIDMCPYVYAQAIDMGPYVMSFVSRTLPFECRKLGEHLVYLVAIPTYVGCRKGAGFLFLCLRATGETKKIPTYVCFKMK